MDSQSKFLVLNKASDWQKGLCGNLDFSDQGVGLKRYDDYATEKIVSFKAPEVLSDIADFRLGKCGVIYLIDAVEPNLCAYDLNNNRYIWVEPLHKLIRKPGKLEFVPGSFYIMAKDGLEQKIITLTQINHQVRWIMGNSSAAGGPGCQILNFNPLDLTADEQGNVYALHSGEGYPAQTALVKIHAGGYIERKIAVDRDIDARNAFIACRNGLFAILDQTNKLLHLASESQELTIQLTDLKTLAGSEPSGLCIDSKDNIYIGDNRQKNSNEEDERFIYKFSPHGKFLGRLYGYRGQVDKLVIDQEDKLFVYNKSQQEITILKPVRRISRAADNALPEGMFVSRAFDSTTAGTVWHRIALDAEIPVDTQVRVSYLAAEGKMFEEKDLDEYISNRDIPLADKYVFLKGLKWALLPPNPKDALLGGTGRYLWLKVELTANDWQTPVLKSIQVHFPRKSYLEYLPAVYQEDEQSRDFTERFLSLFQTFFFRLEGQIDHIARNFDADAVTGDFLRWLASWLTIAVDDNWSEEKLRVLVRKAPELYRKRGTRQGMEEIIELYTGSRPVIVEHFQIKWVNDGSFKDTLIRLFGDDPFSFTVLLKPEQVKSKNDRLTVQRIVDADKPAHTKAAVVVLQPWIYLDRHTYLGINTNLTRPNLRLDVGSVMPRDTVLGDIPEAGQVERRTRLGIDTILT